MNHQEGKEYATPQNLLNSIVNNALFGIMVLQSVRNEQNEIVDFRWIFANQVAARFIGYAVDELVGNRMLELLPANDQTGLFQRYKSVVETGTYTSFMQRYKAEELDVWLQLSVNKLEDGITVSFQDISDLKQAEAELETKGNRYQKLFEESIDAIYLLDNRFNFLAANHSFLLLFQYHAEQILGTSISQLFASEKDYLHFKDALKSKQNIDDLEVDLDTSHKEKKLCTVNCVPLFDEEKHQQNYLGVIRDNSRRKQAEREILRAEKLATTGKIARTIAHEIRNPLTNITLAMEQLKEITTQSDEADTYFNIIERSSRRIAKLINDLLNSSKPKTLKLTKQPIRHLIADTLDLVRDRLNLKKMKLIESYPDEVVEVYFDADQLKIALLNLLINAIEAMEPNRGVLQIQNQFLDDKAEIKIIDNGIGISEEDLDQLFEPFFTGKKDGSGLGLTTVQNIINSHNGSIDVESKVGEGTTFTIRLPVHM